jgi:sporulation protein YlmC with PRC-barrel domain
MNLKLKLGNCCTHAAPAFGFAVLIFFTEARAQDNTNSPIPMAARSSYQLAGTNGLRPERLGLLQMAGDLIGAPVRNRQGLFLGTIKDFVLDFSDGQIYCALLVPAYLYGPTDYFVAVPPAAFIDVEPAQATAAISATNLTESPKFVTGPWDQAAVFRSMVTSFVYFEQTVFWDTNASSVPPVKRFTSLLDREVNNRKSVNVAKVSDMVIDLPAGRVLFAALSFYGSAENLHLAPTPALTPARNGRIFVLDADDSRTPAFVYRNPFLRADLADPMWVASAYSAYGRGLRMDLSAMGNTDAAEAVASALRSGPETGPAAKEVKVTASSGKITLSGYAPSEALKTKFATVAEGVAGKGNVVNRIDVP